MITHLKGRLVEKTPTSVVVECNGVGYEANISLHTYSLLPESENVKLYTFLLVREDSHTLYGFFEPSEREIFKLLLSVSGVGASTARTMLSSLPPKQVQQAIATEDVAVIQGVKGIGAKTAQRVILDLKDKILKVFAMEDVSDFSSNTNRDEALSALETLGFNRKQTDKVLSKIVQEDPHASVEYIIKLALKNL